MGTVLTALVQHPQGHGQFSVSVIEGSPVTLDTYVERGDGEFVVVAGIDQPVLLRNSFGREATEAPVDVSGWHEYALEIGGGRVVWLTTSSLSIDELTEVLQSVEVPS